MPPPMPAASAIVLASLFLDDFKGAGGGGCMGHYRSSESSITGTPVSALTPGLACSVEDTAP